MTEKQLTALKVRIVNKLARARAEYVKQGVILHKMGADVVHREILGEIKLLAKIITRVEKIKTSENVAYAARLHEDAGYGLCESPSWLIALGFKLGRLIDKTSCSIDRLGSDFEDLYVGYQRREAAKALTRISHDRTS